MNFQEAEKQVLKLLDDLDSRPLGTSTEIGSRYL